ncbi:DUF397 domain-containing protein [Streptomyces sp. CC53]|uniref:DUF397 domain-containing protein n=1 Tax=Streptomyces sp. CC53 TaxID=1906740 RepID=UPI0008DDFFEF|nr:DUF397 domain-containing protein [Streptomyces sp. CC53]OII64810.1 DUF397 domain-containing protein [Streptomyces sp. CC53]
MDLYNLPVSDAQFENYCGGNLQGEHESCVEVAAIPGAESAFVIRDTKPEGAGLELRFTAEELDDFTRGWAQKRSLAL